MSVYSVARLLVALAMLLPLPLGAQEGAAHEVSLPATEPLLLEPFGRFADARISESSGLARSGAHAGVYWTHNDSGDGPHIFAVTSTGESVGGPITVTGARNVDWEDIAVDGHGNLVIGDVGDNFNLRRDLCLYVVPEPNPERDEQTAAARRIAVHYPEQDAGRPRLHNYDCEAVFCSGGAVYFLTKNRSDTNTSLYRLDGAAISLDDQSSRALTRIDTFPIDGMVTAADASEDGRRLAVLTYTAIWVFETAGADRYFSGSIRWLPIRAGQCEGICLDGNSLLLANEQGKLFRVALAELLLVRD